MAVGCGHDDVEPLAVHAGPKVVPVTVATAEQRTIESTVDVVGTLKGWEDVKVGRRNRAASSRYCTTSATA